MKKKMLLNKRKKFGVYRLTGSRADGGGAG